MEKLRYSVNATDLFSGDPVFSTIIEARTRKEAIQQAKLKMQKIASKGVKRLADFIKFKFEAIAL